MRIKRNCICGAGIEVEDDSFAESTEFIKEKLNNFVLVHDHCLTKAWKEREMYAQRTVSKSEPEE